MASVAYDAARDRMQLFSGFQAADDLWEWGGTEWELVRMPTGAGVRYGSGLVWHEDEGALLLVGGGDGVGGAVLPTLAVGWLRDGGFEPITLTDPEADGDPAPRALFAMRWDEQLRAPVLHGGLSNDNNTALDDVWAFTGESFVRLAPAGVRPPARDGHAFLDDGAHVILSSGDTGGVVASRMLEATDRGAPPAVVVRVPVAAAGFPEECVLAEIGIHVSATAQLGLAASDVDLLVWRGNSFALLGSFADDASFVLADPDSATLGAARELIVVLTPTQAPRGLVPSSVRLDRFSVRVRATR
jgi:hypothetical protein